MAYLAEKETKKLQNKYLQYNCSLSIYLKWHFKVGNETMQPIFFCSFSCSLPALLWKMNCTNDVRLQLITWIQFQVIFLLKCKTSECETYIFESSSLDKIGVLQSTVRYVILLASRHFNSDASNCRNRSCNKSSG